MPFKKGQIANPKGRGKGILNKSTNEIKDILLENKDKLINLAIERANSGSDMILNKLLDKLIPTLSYNENKDLQSTADYIKERLEKKRSNLEIVKKDGEKERAG